MSVSNLLKVFRQCQIFPVVKWKWPNCHFAVKTINMLPWFLSKFINYVVIFVAAISVVFDVKLKETYMTEIF